MRAIQEKTDEHSSEFTAELGTADEFVSHLKHLTCERLGELARCGFNLSREPGELHAVQKLYVAVNHDGRLASR